MTQINTAIIIDVIKEITPDIRQRDNALLYS